MLIFVTYCCFSGGIENYGTVPRQIGRHHSGGHSSRDSGFSSEVGALCVCVCIVRVYVCVCMCTCVCMCVHECVPVCMYVCVCVHMCVCVCVCVCVLNSVLNHLTVNTIIATNDKHFI